MCDRTARRTLNGCEAKSFKVVYSAEAVSNSQTRRNSTYLLEPRCRESLHAGESALPCEFSKIHYGLTDSCRASLFTTLLREDAKGNVVDGKVAVGVDGDEGRHVVWLYPLLSGTLKWKIVAIVLYS